MTREEIRKALEVCGGETYSCEGCPLYIEGYPYDSCIKQLMAEARRELE